MMLTTDQEFEIVYATIHRGQRTQKIDARKSRYKNYYGYVGKRYKHIQGENANYFTMRSAYTRHSEMTKKYDYNFDAGKCKVLIFLKNKWNQLLFRYLTMFSSGYYLKKRSSKDKRRFKLQNDFQIKKNPLSRMIDLLDKLNYISIVNKMLVAIDKLSSLQTNEKNKKKQIRLNYQPSIGSSQKIESTQEDEQILSIIQDSSQENFNSFPYHQNLMNLTKKSKLMALYDSYKSQGYGGKKSRKKRYKIQSKIVHRIKQSSRKPLSKKTLGKILEQYRQQRLLTSY